MHNILLYLNLVYKRPSLVSWNYCYHVSSLQSYHSEPQKDDSTYMYFYLYVISLNHMIFHTGF